MRDPGSWRRSGKGMVQMGDGHPGTPWGVGAPHLGRAWGPLSTRYPARPPGAPPQLSSPGPASGPSLACSPGPGDPPASCLQATSPTPPSQSHSRLWRGGGMTDGGGAILTRVCSSGGRGGGTLGLVGAGTLHCCHLQGPWVPIPLPWHLSQAWGTQAWGALTQQPCHLGHPDSHGLSGCPLGLQGWEGSPRGQSLKAPWKGESHEPSARSKDSPLARKCQALARVGIMAPEPSLYLASGCS